MTQRRFWMRGSGSALASLAALVTTLCCLGFPALVGFLSALGAGFLLSDRYLEPLLSGTLLLSVVITVLHLRQHHRPGPFILSFVAAGSVFFAIYGIGWLSHAPGRAGLGSLALPPMRYEDHACSHRLHARLLSNTKGRCLMRRIGGVVLTGTGLLACPCHLIITLPWLASLLAGTALGSFLSRNTSLVYTGAGIYFVVALASGGLVLVRRETSETRRGCGLSHLCAW